MRKREERRKNIVIRGTKGKRNDIERKVKKILMGIGIETEVSCKKVIEDNREGGIRMAIISLQGLEQKRKVMTERRRLREKGIGIDDDLTWKERKMRWNIEDIARQERGNARKCLEEMKERWKKGKIIGKWEQKRKSYLEELGVRVEEEEELEVENLESREKAKQKQERMEKIVDSKYNRWYKFIRKDGIPGYLEKNWEEERWSRFARFRLGNEIREELHWEKEENRRCRICEREEETWEHIWEECTRWEKWDGEGWQDVVENLLGEGGEGEEWMKAIEKMRQEGGRRREVMDERAVEQESGRARERGQAGIGSASNCKGLGTFLKNANDKLMSRSGGATVSPPQAGVGDGGPRFAWKVENPNRIMIDLVSPYKQRAKRGLSLYVSGFQLSTQTEVYPHLPLPAGEGLPPTCVLSIP
ncbi:hypothetical protein DBV15_12006 [Temnothorax longispinosus]|uniref:Uncharacterized protein n=1 Tax=Temnothorax longispinosus TaxID=300112 RepID=A0A4S2KMH9_9HYME|nr:hypothetical protein DBV15_12006 [Temnothorax longispinosus]